MKTIFLILLITLSAVMHATADKRISIISDDRGGLSDPNEHLLADIISAIIIKKYDCNLTLRLESGLVFNEHLIKTLSSEPATIDSIPRELPSDILLFARGTGSSNCSINHGAIKPGMDKRANLQKYLRSQVKSKQWLGNRSYYPAAMEIVDQIAKIYALSPKKKLHENDYVNPNTISVAVMAPKIARTHAHTEKLKNWHQNAASIQLLIDDGLPSLYPNMKMLDRSMLPEIIREKKLSFIGADSSASITAMRLLGADYIIRPVIAKVDIITDTPNGKKNKTPGIEITINVINTIDGTICSSLTHQGPYTTEAIQKMLPMLRFPKSKSSHNKITHSDKVLLQAEVDFLLGLTRMDNMRIGGNLIFQSQFNLKCAMAAFALGHATQRNRQLTLMTCGACYTQDMAPFRRDSSAIKVKNSISQAKKAPAARQLFPKLQNDITLFYDTVSTSLNPRKNPRETLHQAYWLKVSGRCENALKLLQEYRQSQLDAGLEDPRIHDHFFRIIGIGALGKLNRPEECIKWIQAKRNIDRNTMFLLADCFAATKSYKEEFYILRNNRRQFPYASFYSKRLMELAHDQQDTEFIYNFIFTEVFSDAYNQDYTQWELHRALLADGYSKLSRSIIQGYRSRKNYDKNAGESKKWEAIASTNNYPIPETEKRQLPTEINPIGTDKILEIIPVGKLHNYESIKKSAQQISTLLGCTVHLYPALDNLHVGGIYDLTGKFYYTKELLHASIYAQPPNPKAIDRVILTDKRAVIMKDGRPWITPYSSARTSGKTVYMGRLPLKNPREYIDSLTLIGIHLSSIGDYVFKHQPVQLTKNIYGFLPVLPDYVSRNYKYDVINQCRASLCQQNADTYKQIDWDNYLAAYQNTVANVIEKKDIKLNEAADTIKKQLSSNKPGILIIKPSKITPEIESLRRFN